MSDAPDYRAALSLLCPLSDPETGTLLRFDGTFWPTDEPTSMTALGLLPDAAVHRLVEEFPQAARPARHHVGTAVEMLAAAVEDYRGTRGRDWSALPSACAALRADVANALAYREVLDAVCGAEDDDGWRESALPVALAAFETGEAPTETHEEGTAALVTTDYLTAERDVRERAGAFLMAFTLAPECPSAPPRMSSAGEPDGPVTAFAREHLHQPRLYAEAVRAQRTLDPQALAPVIAQRAPVPAALPWGA
ncbi:hypothetical protein SA2016_2753 [Sinomonas atrocyanea]|uniref:Uncharacterized protein n=1 Tax=Sinomonas atrocyanea TaxID=37927 RepID=A0A127A1S8_9MICC|nr:hypothetical protein [Sinomonas atrocyanea]AMM33418.1 hypothetical protein SA2016_2753 [Sinomonas atrocyanea]GEB62860.1 hypothetical protein SAT01_03080 [Sinomonas atrocyanea]GGG60597.1 hypothetical protein GCM10007172_09430 [Sinomonas atrocyanea]